MNSINATINKNYTGQTGTMIGWGQTQNGSMATVLKSVDEPVMNNLECNTVYGVSSKAFFNLHYFYDFLCKLVLSYTKIKILHLNKKYETIKHRDSCVYRSNLRLYNSCCFTSLKK